MLDGKVEFNRALGRRVREAREHAGVKQDQLARAVALSRTSITNIERGRQGVHAYLLCRIADVLGRSPADLLPGAGLRQSNSLPDKVRQLEPNKREWAERVMSSPTEHNKDAT